MSIENSSFFDLIVEKNQPPSALEYSDMCRSAPSRMVGAYATNNVCSFVPSKKMGHTTSTESFSAERAFNLLCEYDERVLTWYDQPEPIMIKKYNKNGRLQTVSYTADFLVETASGVFVVEVKMEDTLNELVEKQPKNWVKLADGEYEYIPAVDGFRKIGLRHTVWAYSQSMKYKIFNIDLLLCHRDKKDDLRVTIRDVRDFLSDSFCCSMYDLKEGLGLDSYTPLIRLIDQREIVTDLSESLLSEPKSCLVSSSYELLEFGKSYAHVKIQNSIPISLFSKHDIPSEEITKKVMDRIERIESGEKSRSVRRWNVKIIEGNKLGKNVFQSLIDRYGKSGNRVRRINKIVLKFIDYYIKNDHAKSQGLSIYRSYVRYSHMAKRHHKTYPPASRKTFTKELNKIPESIIALKRGGKRLRNGALEPTDPIKRNLTFQLPWQAAAIDDYLGDIFLVFFTSNGKPYIKKAWISGMIDLATSKILAFTISFKDPSNRSLSKVIRECVRIHGKLPQEILFDRGSNFTSKHTAQLLASLGVINSMRPAALSKTGGEIEGLFGEFIKMWLCQRPGNTADYKEARSVDGKMAPKNSAILKPYDFYRELKLFTSWRDARPVGIGDSSRVDRFNAQSKDFPFMGVEIPYDEKFLMMTAVKMPKLYVINFKNGIHIGELHYWSVELSKLRGIKKKVEVRIDPENPHVIYALVFDKWAPCYTRGIQRFNALDAESQFVEGLIALETRNLKSQLTMAADESLVDIIEKLDRSYIKNNETNIVDIELSNESISQENQDGMTLFEQIKSMKLRKLSTGEW